MLNYREDTSKRRVLGAHLTPQKTFLSYIFPEIKDILYQNLWMDLYCGEGNLIFPILNEIPKSERASFFEEHIFLSEIQPEMIQKCWEKAKKYNIPIEIAEKNILLRDNLKNFPEHLRNSRFPLFHITNPPYLYLGYIKKHNKTKKHLIYFQDKNEGYQDLYQIAMINDLRNNIKNMIYLIPSNFLFGATVSHKIRNDFLKYYKTLKVLIFEVPIFEFTGTNICIAFFKKKKEPKVESQRFSGWKYKKKHKNLERWYELKPEFNYRGGAEFDKFVLDYKAIKPLKVKYYLLKDEIINNKGKHKIKVIDSNAYISNDYERKLLNVNEDLYQKISSNVLYVRTVDTGTLQGRAGLNLIKKDYKVDAIYVSKATYRTSPIHLFLEPTLSFQDQLLLKNYFNLMLEYFRTKLDSEFLTTYKYSNAEYTRKYLGLIQVRRIIETFPIISLDKEREKLKEFVNTNNTSEIFKLLKEINSR